MPDAVGLLRTYGPPGPEAVSLRLLIAVQAPEPDVPLHFTLIVTGTLIAPATVRFAPTAAEVIVTVWGSNCVLAMYPEVAPVPTTVYSPGIVAWRVNE